MGDGEERLVKTAGRMDDNGGCVGVGDFVDNIVGFLKTGGAVDVTGGCAGEGDDVDDDWGGTVEEF